MGPSNICLCSLLFWTLCIQALANQQPSDNLLRRPEQQLSSWEDKLPAGCNINLARGAKRAMFPSNFTFGVGTAAYQVEGATKADGRGCSIWDVYVRTPGKILDGTTADVADDSYHKYKDDVKLMQSLGVEFYRFSLSWARIIPDGTGRVNQLGIDHYNQLIDTLLAAGIQPVVTMYHWDLPVTLENRYKGWLSRKIIPDFVSYADVCFRHFGDRVKKWITINEPDWIAHSGYAMGNAAPGRCSDRQLCAEGNSSTEPYLAGHILLLTHAATVAHYRANYQKKFGGEVGLTVTPAFYYPADATSPADRATAQIIQEFSTAWFFDVIVYGDYPAVMRSHVGSRLPRFTAEESALIRGSSDFFGLNFYTAYYAQPAPPPTPGSEDPFTDRWVSISGFSPNGTAIGRTSGSPWLYVVPHSIYDILVWISKRYPSLPIEIHESGVSETNNPKLSLPEALCDRERVEYYQDHMEWAANAVRDGVNLRSYFAWSLLDNFEWAQGYSERFGLHYVNFNEPSRPAYPKASALWWSSFMYGATQPATLA